MTLARPSCFAAVLLTIVVGAVAGEPPTGVMVLWLPGPATVGAPAALAAGVASELAPLVKCSLRTGTPADAAGWLDDPRALPTVLRTHAAAGGARYVLCARVVGGGTHPLVCEAAWVDRALPVLMAFRTFAVAPEASAGELADELVRFARESLPSALLASPSRPAGEGPVVHQVAEVTTEPPHRVLAPTHSARPQPQAAPLPVGSPADREQASPPSRNGLLDQLGQGFLAVGGLGIIATPPRVLTSTCELRLRPAGSTAPADAVQMVLAVYALSDRSGVDIRFSRPVRLTAPSRRGTRVEIAIADLVVEQAAQVDVERCGLRRLQIRPDEGNTKLEFELTGAGEVEASRSADGRLLKASVFRSEERARQNSLVSGDAPYGGAFRVAKRLRGTGTWYGNSDHGGPTASGERYNQWGWTAAHRTLPFGTWVRVTNLNNGRQVYLRINDRGPFGKDKIIDVSAAAAQALGIYTAGVGPVEIEVLQPE